MLKTKLRNSINSESINIAISNFLARNNHNSDKKVITIFGDIHGDYQNLERLFKSANSDSTYVCLGDIVKDGTEFTENRCIELLREKNIISVLGNHEEMLLNNPNSFKEKFPQSNEYISMLPMNYKYDSYLFVHKSITGKRIKNISDINEEFMNLPDEIAICFFGHTHKPLFYSKDQRGIIREEKLNRNVLIIESKKKYFVNPGSLAKSRYFQSTYITLDSEEKRIVLHDLM